MFTDTVIEAINLSKKYHLYNSPVDRLKEVLSPLRRHYHHDFYALNGIDFKIKRGEAIGIIGKNGSGKSTLLKLLSGVLAPSSGTITVNGRVSALLELGAGFNPELSGLENVYFNGMMLGYSRDEMNLKLADILSFADIGEFIHQPIKTYSSGMFVRLAFSVAISVEPDILIIDEALAVGDVFFQQKCYAKIRKMIDKNVTMLIVSHDINSVSNLCTRGLLLNNGKIEIDGEINDVVNRYIASIANKIDNNISSTEEHKRTKNTSEVINSVILEDISLHNIISKNVNRFGAGGLIIVAARVFNSQGMDTFHVTMMDDLYISIIIEAKYSINNPSAGIQLTDRLGNIVFAAGTRQLGEVIPDMSRGERVKVQFKIKFSLQPGEYVLGLGAAEPSVEGPNLGFFHDRIEMLGPIVVSDSIFIARPFFGIAQLPMSAEVTQI